MYIIDPLTHQIVEIAYSKIFNYASERLNTYLSNGLITLVIDDDSEIFIPASNCIIYPEISDKCIEDYNKEDEQLHDEFLQKNSRLPSPTYLYKVPSILGTIKSQIKTNIDSQIFKGEEKFEEISFNLYNKYLYFLLNNTPEECKVELLSRLREFIVRIRNVKNYYIIDRDTEERIPWSNFVRPEIINKLIDPIDAI